MSSNNALTIFPATHPADVSLTEADQCGRRYGQRQATPQQFADRGAHVAVHYHTNQKAAQLTLSSLTGGQHIIVQADLSNHDSARNLVDAVIRDMGRIDVLVNNESVSQRTVEVNHLQSTTCKTSLGQVMTLVENAQLI